MNGRNLQPELIRKLLDDCQIGFRTKVEPVLRKLAGLLRWGALALGVLVFGLVLFGHYDLAVSLSGRTEVIAIRSDGSEFANWSLPRSEFSPDPETQPVTGSFTVRLAEGTEARFIRPGRGPLTLNLAWRGNPSKHLSTGCPPGALRVGTFQQASGPEEPLCDSAAIIIPALPTDPPLVVSLRGDVTVGEEVRAGSGTQPVLMEATAVLYARHGGRIFDAVCRWGALASVCERFVANSIPLSAGDALHFRAGHDRASTAVGFFRLDPADYRSGLTFDIGAPQTSLEIHRLTGIEFEISESLFERITRSPLIQALNAMIVAFGLISVFLRLPETMRGSGGHGGGSTHHAACIALLLIVFAPAAQAQQALVRAGTVGQAMLRSRVDQCYAIMPQHVLGEETAANLVAPGRRLGDATLRRRIPAAPEEIALMSVRAIPDALCPPFEGLESLEGSLRQKAAAAIRLVRPDGSVERVPLIVQFIDVATFEVRPETGSVLAQGMSGGTVLLGDQPAGLLVDVEEGGQLGRVARLDRIFEHLAPYLGADLPRPAPLAKSTTGSIVAQIVRWTVEPLTTGNGADGLLDPSGAPWRVGGGGPAEIVLKMPPGRIIDVVEVDAGGLDDPPRTVEISVGRSDRGPWQSVALFAIEPGDHVRPRRLPPTRAAFVMIRATGVQPGMATLALAGIRLGGS